MNRKPIVFRCDLSPKIGSGHFMRCFRLAQALKARHGSLHFVLSGLPPKGKSLLESSKFEYSDIGIGPNEFKSDDYKSWLSFSPNTDAERTKKSLANQSIKAIVIDHYGIDREWERHFSDFPLISIDDLANRPHEVDLLIDSNEYRAKEERYNGLLRKGTETFLGCEYALLDPEIRRFRRRTFEAPSKIERIFVCFGGGDPSSETVKMLPAILQTNQTIKWTVVMGSMNNDVELIRDMIGINKNIELYHDPSNLYELMANCQYSFGAGGTMTWERAAIGLPMSLTAVAANQVHVCEDLKYQEYARYLGTEAETTADSYKMAVEGALLEGCPPRFGELAKQCDGLGAERISNWILK